MIKWTCLLAVLATAAAKPQIPISGGPVGSLGSINGFGSVSTIRPLDVTPIGGSSISSFPIGGLSPISGGVKVLGIQRIPDSALGISGPAISGISSFGSSGISGISSGGGSGVIQQIGVPGVKVLGLERITDSTLGISGAGLGGAGLAGAGLAGNSISGADLAASGLTGAGLQQLAGLGGTVTKIERISSSGTSSGDVSGDLPLSTLQQILKETQTQQIGGQGVEQIGGPRITSVTRIGGGAQGSQQTTTSSPLSSTVGTTLQSTLSTAGQGSLNSQGGVSSLGLSQGAFGSQNAFGSQGTTTQRPAGIRTQTTQSSVYGSRQSSSFGAQGAGASGTAGSFGVVGAQGAGSGASGSRFGVSGGRQSSSTFTTQGAALGGQGSFTSQGSRFGVTGGRQGSSTFTTQGAALGGQGSFTSQGSRFGVTGGRQGSSTFTTQGAALGGQGSVASQGTRFGVSGTSGAQGTRQGISYNAQGVSRTQETGLGFGSRAGVTRPIGSSGGSTTTTETTYITSGQQRFGSQGAGLRTQGASISQTGSSGSQGSQISSFGTRTSSSLGSQRGSIFGTQSVPVGAQRTVTRVQETYRTSGQSQGIRAPAGQSINFQTTTSRPATSTYQTTRTQQNRIISSQSPSSNAGALGATFTQGAGFGTLPGVVGNAQRTVTRVQESYGTSSQAPGAGGSFGTTIGVQQTPTTTLNPDLAFGTTFGAQNVGIQSSGATFPFEQNLLGGQRISVSRVQETTSQGGLTTPFTTLAPVTASGAITRTQENSLLSSQGLSGTGLSGLDGSLVTGGVVNPILTQNQVTTTYSSDNAVSGLGGSGLSGAGQRTSTGTTAYRTSGAGSASGQYGTGSGFGSSYQTQYGSTTGNLGTGLRTGSTYGSGSASRFSGAYGSGSGGTGTASGVAGTGAGLGASSAYGGSYQSGVEGRYTIIKQTQGLESDGRYQYTYETENGIQAQESGEVKGSDEEGPIEAVTGSYSYIAPDGQRITVNYIADENGFRAVGDHIPKTPEHVLRTLEYLAQFPH